MLSIAAMAIISIAAALLSSMSVWADKWSDIRLSINDWYMAFLMTGWMFFLEGIAMRHFVFVLIGAPLILLSFYLIRTQSFVTANQWIEGMIPHHSMAVHMSRKLLEKQDPNMLAKLPLSIIEGQESEIQLMKQMEQQFS